MNEFYDRLDELYGAGDLAAVEAFISDAAAGADEHSPERAGLLNELAGFYRGVSRYAESKDKFEQSLRIFESAGMGATPEYATVLLNLAGLYRITGDAGKAIELFSTAKRILEGAGAADGYAYIGVLNNLALAYKEKGEYASALEYATRAYELIRSGIGKEHEIATSLNNIASIHLSLGETGAANQFISEALEIFDAMAEPDVHHAAALTTKAVLMCRNNDYIGALAYFRRAMDLTKRFFGENIEFAICRRNISEIHERLGDIPSAVEELTDSLRVMERILGNDHASVKSAQAKLAELESSRL